MKEQLKEYQNLIIDWAEKRNITGEECAPKQRLKLLEEVGETARAILKNDREEYIDGIGDSFVVLTILAKQVGEPFDLTSSSDGAYKDYELHELVSSIIYHEYNVDFEIFLEICKRLDMDIVECVSSAWNEIKDRKGKTSNGVFIKNEN